MNRGFLLKNKVCEEKSYGLFGALEHDVRTGSGCWNLVLVPGSLPPVLFAAVFFFSLLSITLSLFKIGSSHSSDDPTRSSRPPPWQGQGLPHQRAAAIVFSHPLAFSSEGWRCGFYLCGSACSYGWAWGTPRRARETRNSYSSLPDPGYESTSGVCSRSLGGARGPPEAPCAAQQCGNGAPAPC